AGAVRAARAVAEIEVVVLGQPPRQLAQHGQAAEARVEHADHAGHSKGAAPGAPGAPGLPRVRACAMVSGTMRSDSIKKGINRAPARAMLKATGLDDAALDKPLVAIANTWSDVTPCNIHLRALGEKVKEGVRAAGGT